MHHPLLLWIKKQGYILFFAVLALILLFGFYTLFTIQFESFPNPNKLLMGSGWEYSSDKENKNESTGYQEFREIAKHFGTKDIPLPLVKEYYDVIGPEQMLDAIEENPVCHSQGHTIGRVIYQRTHDLNKAITICQNRCTDACFHGVLEEKIHPEDSTHVSLDEIKNQAETICRDEKNKLTVDPSSCYHAVGHILMNLSGYDINDGIKNCHIFDDAYSQYHCADGAYMEWDLNATSKKNTDDFYPCRTSDYPAACFRHRIYHLTNIYSKDELISKCLSLTQQLQKTGCFHGIGFAYFYHLIQHPRDITSLCSSGNTRDRQACFDGSVGTISFYKDEETAAKLCELVSDDEKKHCLMSSKMGKDLQPPDISIYLHLSH